MSEKNVDFQTLMLEVGLKAASLRKNGASAKQILRYANYSAIMASTLTLLHYSENLEPKETQVLISRLTGAQEARSLLFSEIMQSSLDQPEPTADLVVFPQHQA